MAIKVTREDIGRSVIYETNYGTKEEGVIVAVNPSFIFVRYGNDKHCKATNPSQLEWAHNDRK